MIDGNFRSQFLWVNTKAKLKERALQARAKAMDERLSEASSDAEALREELERAQAEFKKQLLELELDDCFAG